jgi:hypothetical protein
MLEDQKDNTIFIYELWTKIACPNCGKGTRDAYGPVTIEIGKEKHLRNTCDGCYQDFKIKIKIEVENK